MELMNELPMPAMPMEEMATGALPMVAVSTPGDLYERFAAALNADDLDGVMLLFDPEGQTVPHPGQAPVSGLPAVRTIMQQCLALQPQISYDNVTVIQAGDLALLNAQWRLTVTLPDGNRTELAGKGVQVARRQAGGNWRLLIDNPWGAA
jgi:uncharacterized protein (TIGR02246 family)